jgi:hypothetical protein
VRTLFKLTRVALVVASAALLTAAACSKKHADDDHAPAGSAFGIPIEPVHVVLPQTSWPADKQALHVLNRLAFGPRPGEVERVAGGAALVPRRRGSRPQMPGTALPLVLLPHVCFTHFPYALTLEGQYIIKNLTLISAAIVVGGTVRFGARRSEQKQVTMVL